MRSLREFILDGSWLRLMSRLKAESPHLYWIAVAVQLGALISAVALGAYLDHLRS